MKIVEFSADGWRPISNWPGSINRARGSASALRVLFGLGNNVSYSLARYAPVVEVLRTRFHIEANAISLGQRPLTADEMRCLNPLFDRLYPNIFRHYVERDPSHRWLLRVRGYKTYRQIRSLRATRTAFESLLLNSGSDVVVVANDKRSPVTDLINVARRVGIPTLLAQGSIRKDLVFERSTTWRKRVLRRIAGYESGYLMSGQGGCTRIAAWGQNGVDYYRQVGVPEARIEVTGSPRMNAFITRASELDRKAILQRLAISEESSVVLLATNPIHLMGIADEQEYSQAIHEVIQIADRLSAKGISIRLLLKPHPMDLEYHERAGIAGACDRSAVTDYIGSWSLEDAVVAADKVLVFNSTVALEATLVDRPAAMVNMYGWDLGVDFACKGLVQELVSREDLAEFMSCPGEELPLGNAEYYVRSTDAAENVARVILTLGGDQPNAEE